MGSWGSSPQMNTLMTRLANQAITFFIICVLRWLQIRGRIQRRTARLCCWWMHVQSSLKRVQLLLRESFKDLNTLQSNDKISTVVTKSTVDSTMSRPKFLNV